MTAKAAGPGPASEILRVRVEVRGRVYDEDLSQQVGIQPDLDGFNQAFSEHPGRFALWAMIEVYARDKHERLVAEEKLLEAQLFNEHQQRLAELVTTSKGPTLDMIWNAVRLDKRSQAKSKEVADAKLDLETIRVGRQTMEEKKHALQAMAANWRAEMDARLASPKSRMEEFMRTRKTTGTPPE